MPIIIRLDRVMADRKMSLNELSEKVGVTNVNLSKLKTGKVQGVRFGTLEAICEALDCQPGDILEYKKDERTEDRGHSIDSRIDFAVSSPWSAAMRRYVRAFSPSPRDRRILPARSWERGCPSPAALM